MYKRKKIVWQVKNNNLLEMYFFLLVNLLRVGKSQDLQKLKISNS
jgi:hypothetical protein